MLKSDKSEAIELEPGEEILQFTCPRCGGKLVGQSTAAIYTYASSVRCTSCSYEDFEAGIN